MLLAAGFDSVSRTTYLARYQLLTNVLMMECMFSGTDKQGLPWRLSYGVKFYIPDPANLKEDYTRLVSVCVWGGRWVYVCVCEERRCGKCVCVGSNVWWWGCAYVRDNRKPCDSAASLRSLRWGCLFLPVLYKQPTTQPCRMTGMHRDVRLYLITVAIDNLFICPTIDAKIVQNAKVTLKL